MANPGQEIKSSEKSLSLTDACSGRDMVATTVNSSTAGPGRHHGRPGKWENRGLLGSSLDRVLDNDASLMLTTVWKRGKPAKMAVRAQENRACGAKKRRASRATRGLKRRPCGRPHTPVGESSFSFS